MFKLSSRFIPRYIVPLLIIFLGTIIAIIFRNNVIIYMISWMSIIISFFFMIVVSILQFFSKKNYLIIPISLLIVVHIIVILFKITHWPGTTSIMIIGYLCSILYFILGYRSFKKGQAINSLESDSN